MSESQIEAQTEHPIHPKTVIGEVEKAFVEGERYRIYYLHLSGRSDLFLSAAAIQR
jgi:hypothetical protein